MESKQKQAYIRGGGVYVVITIGKNTAEVNGKTVPIDIQDGKPVDTKAVLLPAEGSHRTYVPLRFISEATGATVEYERINGNHYITITTKKEQSEGTKMYGNVAFNPATDTLEDGRMTEEKTREFLDEMVKNIKVYKENGKMYLKYDLIELPEGYVAGFMFGSRMKGGTGKVGYGLTNGNAYLPENQLPRNQSFVYELKKEKMENIEFYSITLNVVKENYAGRISSSSMYYISYNPNTGISDVVIYDKWGQLKKLEILIRQLYLEMIFKELERY